MLATRIRRWLTVYRDMYVQSDTIRSECGPIMVQHLHCRRSLAIDMAQFG
jgi:hypothetical protein